jgi:signal transduction histidine kinase
MIQDDVQAIVELVKNAYDADSPTARIVVDTSSITTPDGREVAELDQATDVLRGTVRVEDRGTGLTKDEIISNWLTVSGSQKREMKRRGETTTKKRTPVGDKGLGRLGTQRLGRVVDLYTVVKGTGIAHRLTIPWDAFESAERLDSVHFTLVSESASANAHGTTLTIRGLRDLRDWQGDSAIALEQRLSAMISPFGDRGFQVSLNIDGQPVDLRERPKAVRANAMVRYQFSYADELLRVRGRVTQDYFRPDRGGADKRALYDRAIARDGGAAFAEWLFDTKKDHAKAFGLRHAADSYLEFEGAFSVAAIDGVATVDDEIVDPGPFSGEIDMVRLRDDIPAVFDSSREYSAFVKEINGVRIYRDGFGIPVAKDWLDLASRWTSGSSFYNLRPENIIGFIDLTAEGNPGLEETSSREQFRDTPAYRTFLAIMERWRKFTEQAQGFLRRGYNEFVEGLIAADAGVETDSTPTVLIRQNEAHAAQADELLKELVRARVDAEAALAAAEQQQADLGTTLFPEAANQLQNALEQIRGVLRTIEQLSTGVSAMRKSYARQKDALVVLREQFDAVQAQLSEAWETVALGLTAEALSHEVSHVTDRLRQRTQKLLRSLKAPVSEVAVRTYAEHVMSSTTALTRQLAHLNPGLRYRRERREPLVMSQVVDDIANHFNVRWSDLGYNIKVDVETKRDFKTEINPGRLTQVLDNLILNSEYWIRSQPASQGGAVRILIDRNALVITDTGPGVDPSLEELIFEPFVSGKRKDGRGLGLFVVRQLLEPEGATIELARDRGADGRRREFVVTFDRSKVEARP